LGILFEFAVGKGRLMVCMADIFAMVDRPEARQLYYSVLEYMASGKFKPQTVVKPELLRKLL
jgi:hypothetical protein